MPNEVAFWIAGIVGTGGVGMLGIFLKGLHHKIENSVSKEEFNAAMESMRKDHETERREIRENQIRIDEQLKQHHGLLVETATKLTLLTSMRPFDQTWGNRKKGAQE